jgi:hypothetical protein
MSELETRVKQATARQRTGPGEVSDRSLRGREGQVQGWIGWTRRIVLARPQNYDGARSTPESSRSFTFCREFLSCVIRIMTSAESV